LGTLRLLRKRVARKHDRLVVVPGCGILSGTNC